MFLASWPERAQLEVKSPTRGKANDALTCTHAGKKSPSLTQLQGYDRELVFLFTQQTCESYNHREAAVKKAV